MDIDLLVYDLYALTPADIALLEGGMEHHGLEV